MAFTSAEKQGVSSENALRYSSSGLAEQLNAMIAGTPCRLGKRPWPEDRDDDKADEGDAQKAPKTTIDKLFP